MSEPIETPPPAEKKPRKPRKKKVTEPIPLAEPPSIMPLEDTAQETATPATEMTQETPAPTVETPAPTVETPIPVAEMTQETPAPTVERKKRKYTVSQKVLDKNRRNAAKQKAAGVKRVSMNQRFEKAFNGLEDKLYEKMKTHTDLASDKIIEKIASINIKSEIKALPSIIEEPAKGYASDSGKRFNDRFLPRTASPSMSDRFRRW